MTFHENTGYSLFLVMSILCKFCETQCVLRTSNTPKNPGRRFWACPKKCKVWIGWADDQPIVKPIVPAAAAVVYHCQRCTKILDLDAEVDLNVKRLSNVAQGASLHLRPLFRKEIKEMMEKDDYSCEACLFPS